MAPTEKISDDARFPSASQLAQVTPPPSAAPRAIAQTPYAQSAPVITTQPGVTPPRMISSPRPISAPPGGLAVPSVAPNAPNGAARPDHRPRTPAIDRRSQIAGGGDPDGSAVGAGGKAPRGIDDPALSLPVAARRPWGLIIVVLAIDIGLAIAGGWMLSEGLGSRPSASGAANKSDPPSAGSQ